MAISEGQLETWSHQGAITTSKNTHESIRNALAADPVLQTKNFEIYLQGSYKNSTNIYSDSDVDVVVQLNDTFGCDLSGLSQAGEAQFRAAYPGSASYTWSSFRADVFRTLQNAYGAAAVTQGKKSIKVAAGPGRQPADVVPVIQHRRYFSFDYLNQRYVEGIELYAEGWRRVVNFPKQHYEHGVTKNGAAQTSGAYKPAVRVFKNARNRAIARGFLPAGRAPSYFLECLLFNVPNACFAGTYQNLYVECVDWLAKANMSTFVCQNEQVYLFGSTPEQWSTTAADELVRSLVMLWANP